jgi:hypothetical protein
MTSFSLVFPQVLAVSANEARMRVSVRLIPRLDLTADRKDPERRKNFRPPQRLCDPGPCPAALACFEGHLSVGRLLFLRWAGYFVAEVLRAALGEADVSIFRNAGKAFVHPPCPCCPPPVVPSRASLNAVLPAAV